PIVQLLALGYLLEAEGRVARTGRFRGSLPGLDFMARLGGALLGAFVLFLPFFVLVDYWHDAALVEPGSKTARALGGFSLAFLLLAGTQSLLAVARGGRLRFFAQPLRNVIWLVVELREGRALPRALAATLARARALRLGHYWKLGLKGFAAALAWIAF